MKIIIKTIKNSKLEKVFKQIAFENTFPPLFDRVKIIIVLCLEINKFAIKAKSVTETIATVDMKSALLADTFLLCNLYR